MRSGFVDFAIGVSLNVNCSSSQVWKVVSGVSLELRAGVDGKPVHVADTAVRGFATRELGKVNDIAALED